MKKIIFLLFIVLFLISCSKEPTSPTIPTSSAECAVNSDCMKGGCSSQICAPAAQEGIITTCEYRPEYDCYQEANCGCVQGTCGWTEKDIVDQCIAEKRNS